MIHSYKLVGSVSGRNRHIRLKNMNQFNKSITSFEIHIRKYYKAIISTDESHASLKNIKLRERSFENHGFFFWIKQFFRALLETINVFHTRSDKIFFIINHDLNGQ